MLEEFDEDHTFPCKDLSSGTTWDIDVLSQKLGIPWEVLKDRPFASSTTYIGFN